jgi:hemerythrin
MAIDWDPKLAVGVSLIDGQHQELFRRVNSLLAAMESNRGKEEVGKLLDFLKLYTVEHFGAEARLMAQYRYPQAVSHLAQHQDFVKTLLELHAEFLKTGPTGTLTVKLNRTVCGWWRQHVGSSDKQLGQFLQQQGVRAVA